MEQFVLLIDAEEALPERLLRVENYDDLFEETVQDIRAKWNVVQDEYFSFLFQNLRARGYRFTEIQYKVILD